MQDMAPSTKRVARLAATFVALVGIALTIAALNGAYRHTDGTLFYPLAAIAGIAFLVAARPRRNKK